MVITHFYPIFNEDLQFDRQKQVSSSLREILTVIDTYTFSSNEDDLNYLAFSTDNGDTFEVQKVQDLYSGSLRIIVEKKILWIIPHRYDKLFEFTDISRSEMEHYLTIYLNSEPSALLQKIETESF